MLNFIIDFSLRYRWLVLLGVLGLAGLGVWSLFHLDIDAFPDTTPVQVQINTVAPALGPPKSNNKSPFPGAIPRGLAQGGDTPVHIQVWPVPNRGHF